MEIQEYLNHMKEIQQSLLKYIEEDKNDEENFHNLSKIFHEQKIRHHRHKLKSLFHLIVQISNNHRRPPGFFDKISMVLLKFRNKINKHFSNFEIFNIFKSNKRIILLLFEENILKMDESIALSMTHFPYLDACYPQYFFNEIKPFLTEEMIEKITPQISDNFEEKRKIGESHHRLCEMIRNDKVKEFTKYAKKEQLSLDAKIEPSIFETNSFLIDKKPTLIQYASFFGSIQILKHLLSNHVSVNSSVWLYAVHCQNPELLLLFKDNHHNPKYKSYEECVKESIKCHHNELAKYLQENFVQKEKNKSVDLFSGSLKYYNFMFIENDFSNTSGFYDLCKYDYFPIVHELMKTKDIFGERNKSNKRTIFIPN
ncbi:hypothetical protein M9Y10_006151 [Tritrichomonas musculus]|uniref:DUF3447 domain-containing protein n=1 Tax=Tritrichomonas musculus TaxID=1915356 RepID=A0ABR2JDX5_9EUKA